MCIYNYKINREYEIINKCKRVRFFFNNILYWQRIYKHSQNTHTILFFSQFQIIY